MRNAWLILLLVATSSCSLKIPLSGGRSTYIGVVTVNEPSEADAPIRHIQRYGMAADVGLKKNSVLLGYQDSFTVTPRYNEVIDLDYQYKRGLNTDRKVIGTIHNDRDQ